MDERKSTIDLVRERRKQLYSNKTPEQIVKEAMEWSKKNPRQIIKNSKRDSNL